MNGNLQGGGGGGEEGGSYAYSAARRGGETCSHIETLKEGKRRRGYFVNRFYS